MVFEPTFEEIDQQADELPDLGGDGAAPDEPTIGGSDEDGAVEADVEGASAVEGAEIEEDDLPPYGEE